MPPGVILPCAAIAGVEAARRTRGMSGDMKQITVLRRSLAGENRGFCGTCHRTLPLSDMVKKYNGLPYRTLCKDCRNRQQYAYHKKRRKQLADIIGDKCAQCGAQDRLTICTKSGAGMKEQHGRDYKAVTHYLNNVREARAELRLLCVTCRGSAYDFNRDAHGCRGRCGEFGIRSNGKGAYASGMKRCIRCEVWVRTDDVFCPCCRAKLRTRARAHRTVREDDDAA